MEGRGEAGGMRRRGKGGGAAAEREGEGEHVVEGSVSTDFFGFAIA